jgi:hypothetical protein
VPTSAEIATAAATTAADGVQSATADGQSATAIDPLKQLDVADRIAARESLAGANPQGGSRSGWRTLRPAQVVPPGAS